MHAEPLTQRVLGRIVFSARIGAAVLRLVPIVVRELVSPRSDFFSAALDERP